MVTVVLSLFLIVYGLNLLGFTAAAIKGETASKRRLAVVNIFMTILGAIGVIYLAAV